MMDFEIIEANAGDCKLDVSENLSRNLRQLKANTFILLKAAEQGYVCKKVAITEFLPRSAEAQCWDRLCVVHTS